MDKKITPKMKKCLRSMGLALGKTYSGSNFDEASKFISENMEEFRKIDMRTIYPPSPKMMKAIDFIECKLSQKFEGHNMLEASEFIDKWLDVAQQGERKSR